METPRVKINHCGMQELLQACNGDGEAAARLMDLRDTFGNLTSDLVARIPRIGTSLVGEFNYEPYDNPDGDIPNPGQGDNAPPSATPVSNLPGSEPLFSSTPRTGPGSSHTPRPEPRNHYDGYSPSPPVPTRQEDAYRSRLRGTHSRSMPTSYHPNSHSYRQSSARWSPGGYRRTGPTPAHTIRQRSLPKSIVFNGSGNWKAFYGSFQAFADQSAWSCAQRKNELRWCLEGQANVFLSTLLDREPLLEFGELVARMEHRYGYSLPPQAIQMELASARQGKDEPIRDWADRVMDLATQAFPECMEHQIQGQAVLYFCQGCYDRDAGAYALNLRPQTVEEAMERVTWRKYAYQLVYSRARREVNSPTLGRNPATYSEAGVRRVASQQQARKSPSGQASPKPPFPTQAESSPTTSAQTQNYEKRLGGLESQVAGLQTSMDNLTAALTQARPRGRSPSRGSDGSRRGRYNCEQPGHDKGECPASTPTKDVFAAQRQEESNSSGSDEEATL